MRTLNDQSMDSVARMNTLMSLIVVNCRRKKYLTGFSDFDRLLKDLKDKSNPWRELNRIMEADVIFLKTTIWSDYLEHLYTRLNPVDFIMTNDNRALWAAYQFVRNLGSVDSPKFVSRLRKLALHVTTLVSFDKHVERGRGKQKVFQFHIASLECISLDCINTNFVLASIFPNNHSSIGFAPY